MIVPGSNILSLALSVIAKQTLNYYAYLSRTTTDAGDLVAAYAPVAVITGSFQPVPKNKYQELGLDLQKVYWTLFVPNQIIDIARDVSGDQLGFNGVRFQCLSLTPWYALDGWNEVLTVQIQGTG